MTLLGPPSLPPPLRRVLGVYDGRLIEYARARSRRSGSSSARTSSRGGAWSSCRAARTRAGPARERGAGGADAAIETDGGREAADCAVDSAGEEQAVCLVDDETGSVTVVQPNEDGSYWRKIVRNKIVRMKEKRRIDAAARLASDMFAHRMESDEKPVVFSSWPLPHAGLGHRRGDRGARHHDAARAEHDQEAAGGREEGGREPKSGPGACRRLASDLRA